VSHSQTKELRGALKEEELPVQRIRIEYVDEKGSPRRVRAMAIQCKNCKKALCIQACENGCIYKDEDGYTVIDNEKCNGCFSCVTACQMGAIVKDEEGGRVLKCDLCPDRDNPACVEVCPTQALICIDR
jgi:carbon-monoxide dehydrogenase iron sulfur subunit